MRYKEFKEKIEDWGEIYNYKPVVKIDPEYIVLKNNDYIISMIYKLERFVLDFNWAAYKHFSENARGDLFKIITEFAATKPEDREDEEVKKYKFKHKYLGGLGNDYLIYDAIINTWYLGGDIETPDFKVKFTIGELKEKFNSNLDDWEIIEVAEDER